MINTSRFIFFTLTLTALLFVSCEEEYFIETGDIESKLVVNCLFSHETPWNVHVTNSINILDNSAEIKNIEHAKVEIFDQNNDFLYELYHQADGIYSRESYSPSPKRGYSIKVSAPGFKTVTASSFVPEKSKLQINNYTIIPNEEYNDVEVDFVIEDRSKLESYYIWEIVSLTENGAGSIGTNSLSKSWLEDLTKNPNDLVRGSREILGGGSFGNGKYTGSYSSFNGNRGLKMDDPAQVFELGKELSTVLSKLNPDIDIPDDVANGGDLEGDFSTEDENDKHVYHYELRVMSISKELFDYYSSVESYLEYNNDSEAIPFEIYTNVSNGIGIFAGYSESVIQF